MLDLIGNQIAPPLGAPVPQQPAYRQPHRVAKGTPGSKLQQFLTRAGLSSIILVNHRSRPPGTSRRPDSTSAATAVTTSRQATSPLNHEQRDFAGRWPVE